MHLNAPMPLFWNTPENTTLLNLLDKRWNMGTWRGSLMRRKFGINCSISSKTIKIVFKKAYWPHIMGPNLHWTKWRRPLFKYAFRQGKFVSPYLAPKPLRWWMIWLKIPTQNRNWLSSGKAGDLELMVLKKAKLHQVGGEGFWDDTKISS